MTNEKIAILIVDDDKAMLEMLKDALMSEGYLCETASDNEAAIRLVENSHFDFFLTDIMMPGIRGFELVEKVKKMKPAISVIIMTGYVEELSFDRVIEAGASDFIKKPFLVSELIIRMRHVQMQDRLRHVSITDELTGLLNGRGFFPLSEQQLKTAKRIGKRIIFAYADFDNLKSINDKFGHLEGDKALIAT